MNSNLNFLCFFREKKKGFFISSRRQNAQLESYLIYFLCVLVISKFSAFRWKKLSSAQQNNTCYLEANHPTKQRCIKNPLDNKVGYNFYPRWKSFRWYFVWFLVVNSSFCYGVDELNIIKLKAEQKKFLPRFFPFIFCLFIRVDDGGWR